ncbi:Aste57867_20181 [Aphanomyces stellatus]|uniref:Aste57867_20181 protein n=1 Tax=Aphanomyces stellatus TaxID=120398 RepID=A0A485LEE2_9STRA|nr:hypothetical protein As57867_020115 [Aphanomyces stellatus]VFT96875.1 Aste57867_20181 [Aphanomyces stellatus]
MSILVLAIAAMAAFMTSSSIDDATCGCKGEMRPCLFLHGLGDVAAGNRSSTFLSYWGDIHDHAPCCSSTDFVHWDTINHGWHSQELQAAFCDAALHVSDGAVNRTIGKLILVAHSMGNLIAASALASGACHLHPQDVSWVHVGGPMNGNWKANYLHDFVCERGPADSGWWGHFKDVCKQIIQIAVNNDDVCPTPAGVASLFHQSTVSATHAAQYAAAQRAHALHVTAAMCGVSPVGLLSMDSIPLGAANAIHFLLDGHAAVNDGAVDFDSCTMSLDGARFGTSFTDPFYKASVNHFDLAFKHGDGWWGDARQPRKWFQCLL